MVRQFRIVTAAIALLAAAGCGIKGPLFLPPPAQSPAAQPAAPSADAAAAGSGTGTAPASPTPAERKP